MQFACHHPARKRGEGAVAVSSRIKVMLPALRKMIGEGLSTAQIAARFGVQSPAITRVCRANGISLPHGKVHGRSRSEPTRADDERDLACIRSITSGEGYHAAAARLRISNVYIQKVVREVEAADLAESGEPIKDVARAYARQKRGGRR
jgi:transposase